MTDNKRKILFVVFIALAAAVICFIFARSEKDSVKSTVESDAVIEVVEPAARPVVVKVEQIKTGKRDLTESYIRHMLEHYVRKTAHYALYFLLAFFVSAAIRFSPAGFSSVRETALSVFICMFCACADEIHQNYVPGRSMMFGDVMIDTSGAIAGALLCVAVFAVAGRIVRASKKDGKRPTDEMPVIK